MNWFLVDHGESFHVELAPKVLVMRFFGHEGDVVGGNWHVVYQMSQFNVVDRLEEVPGEDGSVVSQHVVGVEVNGHPVGGSVQTVERGLHLGDAGRLVDAFVSVVADHSAVGVLEEDESRLVVEASHVVQRYRVLDADGLPPGGDVIVQGLRQAVLPEHF